MSEPTLVDRAEAWLAADPDPETRAELRALIDGGDAAALADRFGGPLAFGTAGLRGLLGAGESRMNRLVVGQVTAGLADHLLADVPDARARGVVIGYDGRKNSRVFADDAAAVLAARGFRVLAADRPWPTPLTAFAVLHRGAAAGIMVTASHNPPDYNGYKVYWQDGAQIAPPVDQAIARCIATVDPLGPLAPSPAPAPGPIEPLGDDLEAAYLAGIRDLSVHPDAPAGADLTVAYTPLHGVGARIFERAMAQAGFSRVHVEPAQREPDPTFSTVSFPNPEEPGAMDRVVALGRAVGADLILANDPDADRLAVAVPVGGGEYRPLTGDQVGALLADYLLTEDHRAGDRLVATTIVSSQLLEAIASAAGVGYAETLTGFKWLARAAREGNARGQRLVLAYEEALGYAVGELVRDKDGVSAAVLFAELAAWARGRGETIADRMEALYRQHGIFLTTQVSLVRPGREGAAQISAMMRAFRDAPPAQIGDFAVVETRDLARGHGSLPASDVLVFRLEGGRRVLMRPSGTEPKLKSYYEVRRPIPADDTLADAERAARAELQALANAHQAMLTPG